MEISQSESMSQKEIRESIPKQANEPKGDTGEYPKQANEPEGDTDGYPQAS